MSVIADNKSFVSNAAGVGSPDFDKATFGIWVSFFQHVNYSKNGYTDPQPLVEDIVASQFTVTGKRFSIVSPDGKAPKARFFLTSGIKGINGYDSLDAISEITNTYISGYKPEILLPDLDFTGKIFRRTEIESTSKSPVSNNNVSGIAAEDWQQTNISLNVTNTEENFAYIDSGYIPYSNEVNTRYKFLYDDSSKSIESNFSSFELPIQLEQGAVFKYRISRKSEPLGQSYFVDLTADGKGVIDYSKYKDEVSGFLDGSLSYDFENIATISVGKGEFLDDSNKTNIIKEIQNDHYSGYLKISKSTAADGAEMYNFDLVSDSEEFNDIYRVGISLDIFKLNSKEGITGYVMSSYNMGDGSSTKTIALAQGDSVYPRVSEDGKVYRSNSVKDLVNIEQILESETFAQNVELQQTAGEESESVVGKKMENYFEALTDALNDKFGEEAVAEDESDVINIKNAIEIKDAQNLLDENSSIIRNETALPAFQLPKKLITSDFYSNYLNSGEKYVAVPLSKYSLFSSLAYGDSYGILGVDISEKIRTVYNSTCEGIYIDEVSFCRGDTATQKFKSPVSNEISYSKGSVTEIPYSNGIIRKENYENQLSWQNAINYYYTKNYVASFDVYPSLSELELKNLFDQAVENVKNAIQGSNTNISSANSFLAKGGVEPRIFVEREIYTEDYSPNQDQELSKILSAGINVPDPTDISTEKEEKLYCVQNYDVSDFVRNKQTFFYPVQNYNETIIFDSFVPNSEIHSYTIADQSTFGVVLFADKNPSPKKIFRAESVIGGGSTFSYSNFSSSQAWNGLDGGTITITNQDTQKYGYHLYTYTNSTDALVLAKSNVRNGEIADTSLANAVVIKFNKENFVSNPSSTKEIDSEGKEIEYFSLFLSAVDSNGNVYDATKVKINVQIYNYSLSPPKEVNQWYIFNKNPINDNSYGIKENDQEIKPRFFEDSSEETKAMAQQLFFFPNGPCTSKNYEGSPISAGAKNGLANGLFENNILITEERGFTSTYESNSCLDVLENGIINKQKSPAAGTSSVLFSSVKRLKITKVKYNFYAKDLILIGDAGFPNSKDFNYGWQFKLQYRDKGSSADWGTLEEKGPFNTSEITTQFYQISPYYGLLGALNSPYYLEMIAFKTNIPLFLDDSNYEFRIAKYEKLAVFSSDLDVIKKVNFIPIKVQWTADPDCQYYNIYQKDSGNNLTFLATENTRNNLSYAVPDVKQSYIDLGPANFGSPNFSGYYDIRVSGIVPSVKETSNSISSQYGFDVGDSNAQFLINKISNEANSAFAKQINNPTYTPLINFNNPESKNSAFTINQNYNKYYFVSNSASASLEGLSNIGFEGYVANTGASSCSVGAQSVSSNNVASISNNGVVTTSSLQSLPSAALDLKDTEDDQCLYLISGVTISNSTSINRVLNIVNDSSSSIAITYNGTITIQANTTAQISFLSSSASVTFTRNNITAQDDVISYPSVGLVNINHSRVNLDPSNPSSNFPIYNVSNSKLSVNGALDLNAKSFNVVNWNGSTASNSQKNIFDSIKIFILGTELESERITLLKDDTDIIISNFQGAEGVSEEYFFIKDETITRYFNINIINGSSTYELPIKNQDFKLTVYKRNSVITYSILYPSDSPFFNISNNTEQLILLTRNNVQNIDLNYLEASIPKQSFIYIVNKSQSEISFYKGDITQSVYTVSPNQIARASISTIGDANGIKIDIIDSAYSHFVFNIDAATHLSDSINILDLNFCGTSITTPSASSFASKNTFLLCRNRSIPNKIDNQFISAEAGLINDQDDPSTNELNEIGQLSANSISLSLYRKNVSDTLPTLERTSFINQGLLGSESSVEDSVSAFFYIKDDNLKHFSIRDFYNRKSSYSGKVFLPSPREIRINSFDDNHFLRIKSQSISFDYSPDTYVNGRLYSQDAKDSAIISRDTEKASTTKTFPNALNSDQILINFSYDTVNVTVSSVSKTIKKNRLIKNDTGDLVYPVYNNKEFFIADSNSDRKNTVTAGGTTLFYQIIGKEIDVESIVLPDISAVITYVIKNSSSRTYPVYTLRGILVHNLAPNTQKEFVYNGSSYDANNNSVPYGDNLSFTSIKTENQILEVDLSHPLSSLWSSGFSVNAIRENFIVEDSIELIIDGSSYQYAIFDVLDTVPADSSRVVYCYGRKPGILDIGDNKYLVNAFYLYLIFNGTIVKENEFYTTGDGINTAAVYPLSVIEYKHTDLLKFLPTYQSVISLPNVILIPLASQLVHYYLPNLSVVYSDGSQNYTLGSLLSGKKIVFVNTVKTNSGAENKVTNYNGAATESLEDVNSVVMYEISGGQWVKSTSGVPVVKPVYPTLDRVKGLSLTQTSEIADGREFVYLPNFSRFNVTVDSFTDKELKNFYVLNSASNRVFINSNQSMLSSSRFMKIYRNLTADSFDSQDLEIGGTASFVSVEIELSQNKVVDDVVAEKYPNLKFGTSLKATAIYGTGSGRTKYTHFYRYGTSGAPAKPIIKNESFADLDLFNLKSYSPNDKLFVYGSSNVNAEGVSFDSYDLRVLKSDSLSGEKFYIYNNSSVFLRVFFKESDSGLSSDSIAIPSKRMVEISDNAVFLEYHEKGKFYISSKKLNKTYINKIDLPIFVDAFPDYKSLTGVIEAIQVTNSISSIVLSLSKYKEKAIFYYTDGVNKFQIDFDNNSSLNLPTFESFYLKSVSIINIKKPIYSISSSGHYILNNSNVQIEVDCGSLSQSLFLVNNCAENILVTTVVSSVRKNILLYRNTVLILNSSGASRYIKKAKRRDDFYCVFNPKTAISTQNEISFVNAIERNLDVQPILNDNGVEQQSYIKLLSRYGSSTTIYLSLTDYYNGLDVPTDSQEGIVAYEVGIGHETISKFLFFDPSKSTYTLPGIVDGETYRVDIDYALFDNISNLNGQDTLKEDQNPYVIYNGEKYYNNEIIKGSYMSFYEVKYPNYVRVFKVTEDQPLVEDSVAKESDLDESIQEEIVEPLDKTAIFYQTINESITEALGSSLSWIPRAEEAFWMTSDVGKDVWEIESVQSGYTKQFIYDDRQVTFTRCTLKKTNLRSKIFSNSFVTYSALQERSKTNLQGLGVPADDMIVLGSQLNPEQQKIITNNLRAENNIEDYIIPSKQIFLGDIKKSSLFPSQKEKTQIVNTEFEINVSVDKIKNFPAVSFEDFSKSQIIKILNDKA